MSIIRDDYESEALTNETISATTVGPTQGPTSPMCHTYPVKDAQFSFFLCNDTKLLSFGNLIFHWLGIEWDDIFKHK